MTDPRLAFKQYGRVVERQLAEARVEIARLNAAAAGVRRAALQEAISACEQQRFQAAYNNRWIFDRIIGAILALIPSEPLHLPADDGGGK